MGTPHARDNGRMARGRRFFRIQHVRRVDAGAEHVVAVVRQPARWPEWQPELVSAEGPEVASEGDLVLGRAHMLGFHVDGVSRILEAGEDHLEHEVVVGVRIRMRYEVAPDPAGAAVTHRLTVSLPGGPSGRVLSLFLRPRLRAMSRAVLEGLSRSVRRPPGDAARG